MKKRTAPRSVLARLRSAAKSLGRAIDRGNRGGYEAARISAELTTIAERRSSFDR